MIDTPPLIYASRADARRGGLWTRSSRWRSRLACLAVLVRAALLVPSASGMGTHTAMGLARCSFVDRTALPCPSCGMTTSFAWFVRGNILASLYVQPMGTLLAAAAAVCAWGGAYVAATGRPIYRLVDLRPGRSLLVPILGFALAAWGWKILLQLNGWDGWR